MVLAFREGLNLASEVGRLAPGAQLAVPASVLRELETLESRSVAGARPAREWAQRLPVVPTTGHGDEAIVALARTTGAIVITADRALRDRLSELGLRVLEPRDRVRLTAHRRRAGAATVKNRPRLAHGRRPVRGAHARRR